DGRKDLARRAIAALKAIAVQKCGLHGGKLAACGEAFNRDDLLAVARRRQGQAGQNTLAVDHDRAGAAGTLIAAFLRASQAEYVAERVQQRQARVRRELVRRVVDAKGCLHDDYAVTAHAVSADETPWVRQNRLAHPLLAIDF